METLKRQQHDLQQGSSAWHDFRAQHIGASEIAAVLGLSKYTTRAELLRIKATGITPDVDSATQRIFDRGHETEALARPIAEGIVGEELYPTTWSYGRLSASCDGLTAMDDIGFEHKQFNKDLFELVSRGELPDTHMPQVQQCLLVTGAEKWLFMVSDGTEQNCAHMWVYPDQSWFERIEAAAEQFYKDLETYTPPEIIIQPKADAIPDLPALFIHAKGEITTNNMREYGEALAARLADVRAIVLVDDKDFANAKAAAKMFRSQIEILKTTKAGMLAQTTTIGEAAAMIDAWAEDLRVTALQLEKDVEREDKLKKESIVQSARIQFSNHVAALQAELAVILNVVAPNFAEAIKNKRNYESMQQAVDGMLANAKLDADAVARDLREKHGWYIQNAGEYSFLFSDLQSLIYKDADSFQAVARNRILTHQDQERIKTEQAAKAQAEREERIRMEAEEKAKREVAQREEQIKREAAAKERELIAAEQEKERAGQKSEQEKSSAEIAENPSVEQKPVFNKEIQDESEAIKAIPVEIGLEVPPKVTIPAQSKVGQSIEAVRLPTRNQIIAAITQKYPLVTEAEAIKAIRLAFPELQQEAA